ncbi:hypothetical protein MHU86_13378 [Fragilaria crotonensis]|nr:hypothetical protein MHU86_13378 [Fragilaria crotonensis]
MMMQSVGSKSGSVALQVTRTRTCAKRMPWSHHYRFSSAATATATATGRMVPMEHQQDPQQRHSQSFHCYSNINRQDFSRRLRAVELSRWLHSESESHGTGPNQFKEAKVVGKDEESDNYHDSDYYDDDDDKERKSKNTTDEEGITELEMSVLQERYHDSLKQMLEDKHGITIDEKKQNWISPWRIAVIIHCLDTDQNYSIITKRPAPTPKEVEQYVRHQGIHDTKDNRLRARMEMRRNRKEMARKFLIKVMEERGHVMRRPPKDKSDWQELCIQIQESVLQVIHNSHDGPEEMSPSDSTRA